MSPDPEPGRREPVGHRLRGNATFANPDWDAAALRVLIVRLSSYEVSQRSSTHLLLAHEARRASRDVYLDFLFFPPGASSLRARRKASEFDLLLVSSSYVLELLNLPLLLGAGGVPLKAEERLEGDPIVVLGGASAMAAHAVVEPREGAAPAEGDGSAAGPPGAPGVPSMSSLVDAVYFGEGEGEVERIVSICLARREQGRGARLEALASGVRALWAPTLTPPASGSIRKGVLASPGVRDLPTAYPILDGEQASTARLQITLGCPALCSFCFEAFDRRPFREIDTDALLQAAREIKRSTGAERLELFSFNFSYHSGFPRLVHSLLRMFASVGFMSQRIDVLARNPELLAFEIAAGKRSYTLGIEGISARQRAFLRKGIATSDLEQVLAELIRLRVREIKLFYIVTGYEAEADYLELASFLDRLAGDARSGGPRVILSFTYLLRMPFTPLRYDALFLSRDRAEEISRRLRRETEERGFEARFAGDWEEHVLCQLLVAGGYGAGGLYRRLLEERVGYDGSLSRRAWPIVESFIREHADELESLVREKPLGRRFPLEFVVGTPPPAQLYERYLESRDALERLTPESPLAWSRKHSSLPIEAMEELVRAKQRLEQEAVYAFVRLDQETAGASPEWRNAWILRRLFLSSPELVERILRVEEVAFRDVPELGVSWYGLGVARVIAWEPAELRSLLLGGLPPFTSPAPRAEPWVFRSIEARLSLPAIEPQAAGRALAQLLTQMRCPAVTVRDGHSYVSRATASALKRRSFIKGRLSPGEPGCLLELTVGPRFPMRSFLDTLASAHGDSELCVEVTAIET